MDWKGFVVVLMCLLAWAACARAGDVEVGLLTDAATSQLEGRVGLHLDEVWTVGVLGTWFAEDRPTEWGVGAYAKMTINPDASVPLAGVIPPVGDWLNLPESIAASTYLIGKFEVLPFDDNIDLAFSPGAGFLVGPVLVEYTYQVIESGDSARPDLSSGAKLWFGLCLSF